MKLSIEWFKRLLVAILAVFSLCTQAQTVDSINHVHSCFYIAGDGAFFSGVTANYEMPMEQLLNRSKPNAKVLGYLRLQAGYKYGFLLGGGPSTGLAFTGLTGKGNHHFEFSAGGNVVYEKYKHDDGEISNWWYLMPQLDVGYRYQKPEGGAVFRIYVANIGVGISIGGS